MREALFVAYWFPPMGGSGVIRPLKFAKYLHQFGWKPAVLTVAQGDTFTFDQTLIEELSSQVVIERAPSVEIVRTTQAKGIADQIRGQKNHLNSLRKALARFLKSAYFSVCIPDDKIGWVIPAVRKAARMQKYHDFKVIYATSPPQTSLIVATTIQRRLQIPLVLDYRDEWTTNPHKYMPNPVTLWLNRCLEKYVIDRSDALLVMSGGVKRNLCEAGLLKESVRQKCEILPNGFDPTDYDIQASYASAKFSIVYTGSFYGELRIPDPFLRALFVWLESFPRVRNDVQVLFQGSIYPQHLHLIYELGLDDVVQVADAVSHQQAIATQQNASVLLLVMGKGEGTAILPGKVFEYLGARRPILAIVHPEGESAALIRKTNTGIVIDPEHTGEIVQALQNLYMEWQAKGKISYIPNENSVEQYSRIEQTRQLSELFERLAG